MLIDAAKMVYKEVVKDFASIYLVYGKAGTYNYLKACACRRKGS